VASTKQHLVIVESPSKAKTIGKFLGSKYKVIASVGHVRDLPKSKLGINIDNDFEPEYISIRGKGDLIKELRKAAKGADKIFLATDPDREGEAISWHLQYLLGLEKDAASRIVFNEITKEAVQAAVKNPRPVDTKLVDAQQARRVLDRLVGYSISPLLWRKIRRGLSAGRVQSAALKIICDREEAIRAFVPEEYWNILAIFHKEKPFTAKLALYKGDKLSITNGEDANRILEELKKGIFTVDSVEAKERTRNAYAPFTTSSLQQDASNKLNYSTKKTMQIAQQLYEGVEIKGRGTVGLVSYIRTDSVRISEEAKAAAKTYIANTFGENYIGNNFYSNKKKEVQDAHEAIRPSYVDLTPDQIKASLSKDQYNLYKLIWNRFLASQMKPAVYMGMTVGIINQEYLFKANGSKLLFEGFLKVYSPGKDDEDKELPLLTKGEVLSADDVKGEQNFTQPPSRFTEASLVKELEEDNIGRPSTYAPIIGTLTERKYIAKEKKFLIPTDLGFLVNQMMIEYFPEVVDVGFTSDIEDKLDLIEVENLNWKSIIRDFYVSFKKDLDYADEKIEKVELEERVSDEICELCGKPMVYRHGRFGEFLACTGYPDCKNTKMIVHSIGVSCPTCGKEIIQRKSKKGRLFYGCSGYPACNQLYWNKPTDKECPKCGARLVEKKTKQSELACSNSECDYKE
jgi:DNA topoisomerase I